MNGVVNSPTFTIIKEYEGRLPLYHMDVYRLSIDEADELGLDEYFLAKGFVSWSGAAWSLSCCLSGICISSLKQQAKRTGPSHFQARASPIVSGAGI